MSVVGVYVLCACGVCVVCVYVYDVWCSVCVWSCVCVVCVLSVWVSVCVRIVCL